MALLDKAYKQRMVGALVLVALAVIFLPMLFTREDESRQVVVEAPPRPQSPAMPSVEVQPTEVPELQPGEEGIAPEIVEEGSPAAAGQPSQPIGGLPATPPATQPPAQKRHGRPARPGAGLHELQAFGNAAPNSRTPLRSKAGVPGRRSPSR